MPGRPMGAQNKHTGTPRPTERGVNDVRFYKYIRHTKRLRCEEIATGTRQCINPADYEIRWHGFEDTMSFCHGHKANYDYPDSSLCDCAPRKGTHVHYDLVRTLQPPPVARQRVGELTAEQVRERYPPLPYGKAYSKADQAAYEWARQYQQELERG